MHILCRAAASGSFQSYCRARYSRHRQLCCIHALLYIAQRLHVHLPVLCALCAEAEHKYTAKVSYYLLTGHDTLVQCAGILISAHLAALTGEVYLALRYPDRVEDWPDLLATGSHAHTPYRAYRQGKVEAATRGHVLIDDSR
jgi:hypothetical protein